MPWVTVRPAPSLPWPASCGVGAGRGFRVFLQNIPWETPPPVLPSFASRPFPWPWVEWWPPERCPRTRERYPMWERNEYYFPWILRGRLCPGLSLWWPLNAVTSLKDPQSYREGGRGREPGGERVSRRDTAMAKGCWEQPVAAGEAWGGSEPLAGKEAICRGGCPEIHSPLPCSRSPERCQTGGLEP